MPQPSPTNLRTPRNMALEKGTAPGGFSPDAVSPSMLPITSDSARAIPRINNNGVPVPATPNPYR